MSNITPQDLEFGTAHVEPLTPKSGEDSTLTLTVFRQNAVLKAFLTEDKAFELGTRLLAWCQLRKEARR